MKNIRSKGESKYYLRGANRNRIRLIFIITLANESATINNFLSAYSSISLVVPILKLFVTIAKTKFKKKNKPKNINIAKYRKVSVCAY